MAWIYLLIAGLFEVAFTTSLKLSNNFTNSKWTVAFFVSISLSFHFLNEAIQKIPLGTAYAVWTGLGAFGAAIIGIVWLGDSRETGRLVSLALVLALRRQRAARHLDHRADRVS